MGWRRRIIREADPRKYKYCQYVADGRTFDPSPVRSATLHKRLILLRFSQDFQRRVVQTDDKKPEGEDMRYLVQPRGPGKSWAFRMVTPPDLVGVPNPWDRKPFGKEIKKGLGTRRLPEARKLRDIALGDIRRLEDDLSDGAAFSLASAVEWREAINEARRQAEADGDPFNVGVEFVLHDKLEEAKIVASLLTSSSGSLYGYGEWLPARPLPRSVRRSSQRRQLLRLQPVEAHHGNEPGDDGEAPPRLPWRRCRDGVLGGRDARTGQ